MRNRARETSREPFITDAGEALRLYSLKTNVEVMYLPRYAAWKWDAQKQAMQVVECSDCLEYLQVKHSVHHTRIARLSISGEPK